MVPLDGRYFNGKLGICRQRQKTDHSSIQFKKIHVTNIFRVSDHESSHIDQVHVIYWYFHTKTYKAKKKHKLKWHGINTKQRDNWINLSQFIYPDICGGSAEDHTDPQQLWRNSYKSNAISGRDSLLHWLHYTQQTGSETEPEVIA